MYIYIHTQIYIYKELINQQAVPNHAKISPAAGFELPHCGLRGELPLDGDLGVVLVCHLVAQPGYHRPPEEGMTHHDLPQLR